MASETGVGFVGLVRFPVNGIEGCVEFNELSLFGLERVPVHSRLGRQLQVLFVGYYERCLALRVEPSLVLEQIALCRFI